MAHELIGGTLGPSPLNRLKPRERVRGNYRVKSYRLKIARNGTPYAAIWLTDGEGQLLTYVWGNIDEVGVSILEDTAVQVEFHTRIFNQRLVADLDEIDPIKEPPILMPIWKRPSSHVVALLNASAQEATKRRQRIPDSRP